MEKLVKGDIVVIDFPYSDLTNSKKRPSLVVADLNGDDLILCQITSKKREEKDIILLKKEETTARNIDFDSFIRASRLFTANKLIIHYKLDHIKTSKIKEVENKLCEIFTR